MANLKRGKTEQYLKMWLKKLGGGGGRNVLKVFIANGAFWINLDHQLRTEILPIFSNIVYSSPATYFILVIRECDWLFCIDADTRRGGGAPLPKRGSEFHGPPLDPPLDYMSRTLPKKKMA